MTEHAFDLELIMAIAEGTIPPDEAAAAERALDEEGRTELASQRKAIAALSQASAPSLTDAERMAMRSAVRTAVNLNPEMKVTRAPAQASPWYFRFLPMAAGLGVVLVVVGIGLTTIIGGIGFGGSDQASESVENLATVQADDGAGRDLGQLASVDEATADSFDSGGADAEAAPATVTADQSFAATTAAATDGAASSQFFEALAPINSRDLEQIRAVVGDALSDPDLLFDRASEPDDFAAGLGLVCLFQSADGPDLGGNVLLAVYAIIDGEDGQVYVVEQGAASTIYLYLIDECTLVAELDLLP